MKLDIAWISVLVVSMIKVLFLMVDFIKLLLLIKIYLSHKKVVYLDVVELRMILFVYFEGSAGRHYNDVLVSAMVS